MNSPSISRLTMHDVVHSVLGTLNLERGIFRTLLDLFVKPRSFFDTYFFKDRGKYTQPTTLLMLMLAGVLLSFRHLLPSDDTYSPNLLLTITASNEGELQTMSLLREYDDLLRLMFVPITSVLSYLLFRKQGWHLAEHMVFNSYILAFQFFVMFALVPLLFYQLEWIVGVTSLVFFLYVYVRCMDGPPWLTLVKSVGIVACTNLLFIAILYQITLWLI